MVVMLLIVYNTFEFKVFVAPIRVGPIVGLSYGLILSAKKNANSNVKTP